MAEKKERKDFTVEIQEHLEVLEEFGSGWKTELNIVKWGDNDPKFDIRQWSPDHEKMSRGITLFDYEMEKLVKAYKKYKSKK